MKNTDERIEEALNSINKIQRAEMPHHVSDSILLNAASGRGKIIALNPMVKWYAAASIVFLIGVNVVSIIHFSKSTNFRTNKTNPVYLEYFTYLNEI